MKTPDLRALRARLPAAGRALFEAVLGAADADGEALYLVGGPVRDLLMDRPLRDVDLLWVPESAGSSDWLARLGLPGVQATRHDRFGTLRLRAESGAALDLATARSESYPRPGALPRVGPGDLAQDLARRDFSVNAMALPLSQRAQRSGARLVDPCAGLADLRAGRLRILHAQSFSDDPTRMLRAARFAVRLGFRLEAGTRQALRRALAAEALAGVSGDRLRRELTLLFEDAALGVDPARTLQWLARWRVLDAIAPGLEPSAATRSALRRLGRLVAAPPWSAPRWSPALSGWMIWWAPLTPARRARVIERIALVGQRAECAQDYPRRRRVCMRELARAHGRGAVDAALAPLDEESLHALHAEGDASARRRIERFAVEDRERSVPLDGNALAALGFEGAEIGTALRQLRRAWLDGALVSRDDALAFARELRGRPARSPRRSRPAPSGGTPKGPALH